MGPASVKCWLLVVALVLAVGNATDMTPDEVQAWMLTNDEFDWQQEEADAVVQIAGKGAQDAAGNLYFAGSKSLDSSNVDLLDIFVARINADGSLGWTKEVRTWVLWSSQFGWLIKRVHVSVGDGSSGRSDFDRYH
jgi:hypothetical protein